MSNYINVEDIKDTIVEGFADINDYLDETDSEINDLAQSVGVAEDSIDDDPLHYKIKRYAIVFCIKRLCQDKSGKNNVELPDFEKYTVKEQMYAKELDKLRQQITAEMFTGVTEIRDRATVSGTLFRG